MVYLLEVPLTQGRLIAEVDPNELAADDLVLASPEPGRVVAKARETLERSLDVLRPALRAVLTALEEAAPSELTVEFGIKLGGETGVILAKGTTEVNFAVTMVWKSP